MVVFLPRSAWTSRPVPTGLLVRLRADEVRGVAVHYVDAGTYGQHAPLELSVRRLQGILDHHIGRTGGGKGWSDIAYQVAIDVEGRVFDARGIAWRSAANGNQRTNSTYGAVLFLIKSQDRPTPEMIKAFQEWRYRDWLKRYPKAATVVGHGDIWETSCPGPRVRPLIRNGTLSARPKSHPTGGNMSLTPVDVESIVTALVTDARFLTAVKNQPWQAAWNLSTDPAAGTEKADIRLYRASHPEYAKADIAEAVILAFQAAYGSTLAIGPTLDEIKEALREVLVEGTGGTP